MKKLLVVVFLTLVLTLSMIGPVMAKAITVTILHTNDMHAHVEAFTLRGRELGGYARQATLINRYRASDPNPILLCAGDTFQGTMFFNVFEGLADLAYMNYAGYQAMAIGNHEFDRGPAKLAAFAKLARFPLLAANLDVGGEKELVDLVKPYTVIEVGGERIGVVGAVPPELMTISTPGPSIKLKDLVTSVQAAIDELLVKGVDKIIVLSHVGYREDIVLAGKLKGVDVIVGGHSHTLLGTIPSLPQPWGEYPTLARDIDGNTVVIVQAWDWGKVLGRIKVDFDDAGRVMSWKDALPVPVDPTVAEDPTVKSMVAAFSRPIAAMRDEVVSHSEKGIVSTRATGRHAENPMANVITDAMLMATERSGSVATFVNAGGVRASIDPGPITYGQAVMVQPFNNTLVQLDFTGAELKAVLDETLGGMPDSSAGLLYPSRGTSYGIDISKPAGQRVVNLLINGEPVKADKVYRVTLPSFVAGGGDAHILVKNASRYRYDTGLIDIDAFVAFLKANDPINGKLEGRVVVVGQGATTK